MMLLKLFLIFFEIKYNGNPGVFQIFQKQSF